ncbi:hypothetical protein CDAR_264551 [Caerostris darwini]|uniref:Uncharacterized protein n=1 Tax=Caerostris darwini TaxID=1538125 RepID=A0AAV4NKP8_9ARAC|nr:hypothetical protein CDAR_264551 [Caerostris darwini]
MTTASLLSGVIILLKPLMHVTRKFLVYRILYHSFNKLCSETSSHTYSLSNCDEICDANNLRFNSSLLDLLEWTRMRWRVKDDVAMETIGRSFMDGMFSLAPSTGCYQLLNTESVKGNSWCLYLLGGSEELGG